MSEQYYNSRSPDPKIRYTIKNHLAMRPSYLLDKFMSCDTQQINTLKYLLMDKHGIDEQKALDYIYDAQYIILDHMRKGLAAI